MTRWDGTRPGEDQKQLRLERFGLADLSPRYGSFLETHAVRTCSFRLQVLVFFCGQIQERRQAIGKNKKQSSNFETKTDSKMLACVSPTFRVPLLRDKICCPLALQIRRSPWISPGEETCATNPSGMLGLRHSSPGLGLRSHVCG